METIKQSSNENKELKSIKMYPSLWDRIDSQAGKEKRSRQNMLEVMAEFYLDQIAEREGISLLK